MSVAVVRVPGPTFTAPWLAWFSGVTGWLLATALFILAIVMVTGLAAWVWGKMDSSTAAQSNGIIAFVMGAVGASVIAVAGTLIVWATELGPNWASF